jgi:hypothetical protein
MMNEATTRAPAIPYKAIGHGRELRLDALGVPAVLVFVGRETSKQAQPIVEAVRETYPDTGQVIVCNIADVRGIPKLVRKPVEMLMKASYREAVENLVEGRKPEEYVLILPDWDGAAYESFGVHDVSTTPAVGVLDAHGNIVGMVQGDDMAAAALEMLSNSRA